MKLFPISRYTVSGHSMLPTLKPGQDILVVNWFFNLKVGDIVIFKMDQKLIIKRVKIIKGDYLKVEGDNRLDSKDYGSIRKTEVLGKMIFKL